MLFLLFIIALSFSCDITYSELKSTCDLDCSRYKVDSDNCPYCECYGTNCPWKDCFDQLLCPPYFDTANELLQNYKLDHNGCPICSCCPMTVTLNTGDVGVKPCPDVDCVVGLKKDPDTGCIITDCECLPDDGCDIDNPYEDCVDNTCSINGIWDTFVLGDDGCMTCDCVEVEDCVDLTPDNCEFISEDGKKLCEWGFKHDDQGCPLCECLCQPYETCPEICKFGYVADGTSVSGNVPCTSCKCVECDEVCDNGYKFDPSTNAYLCECRSEIPCPEKHIKNPNNADECTDDCEEYIFDARGCNTCKCMECPPVKCDRWCKEYKIDERGCQTCYCDYSDIEGEEPCDPITCDLFCKYGYKTDKRGCEICECNICPNELNCQWGVKYNVFGEGEEKEEKPVCYCNEEPPRRQKPCKLPPKDPNEDDGICKKKCPFGYEFETTNADGKHCPKCKCKPNPNWEDSRLRRGYTNDGTNIPKPPCDRHCPYGYCWVPISLAKKWKEIISNYNDETLTEDEKEKLKELYKKLKEACKPYPPKSDNAADEEWVQLCICIPEAVSRVNPKNKKEIDPKCKYPPCDMFCQYGYEQEKRFDDNNMFLCPICRCRKPPCRRPPINDEGNKCDVDALGCDHGLKIGEDRCPLCECNDVDPCPDFNCDLACEFGFILDEKGCKICECRERPKVATDDGVRNEYLTDCKVYECDNKDCEYGYQVDEYGCLLENCECSWGNSTSYMISELNALFAVVTKDDWYIYLFFLTIPVCVFIGFMVLLCVLKGKKSKRESMKHIQALELEETETVEEIQGKCEQSIDEDVKPEPVAEPEPVYL